MTLLYSDPRFLDHETGEHPESAVRLATVVRRLEAAGIADRCERPVWLTAPPDRIEAVHDLAMLEAIQRVCRRGGGRLDADTVASAQSYDVASLAAGAAVDATRRVLGGEAASALCLVRPPGHHALGDRAMGFCLMNNIAIAAQAAIDEFGLDRVLIVDWDVHHGNGTQAIFYGEPRVAFFSIHRWPFYPGTGAADETGSGDGLGATRNLPIEFGTPRQEYLKAFAAELEEFADRVRPQLVLLSAGFDSHREDPIGSLGLEVSDFVELSRSVLGVARTHAERRVVSLLEGGYHPLRLAECIEVHLGELLAADH